MLDPQKEEWFHSRCNASYFPNKGEKVKRANKFKHQDRRLMHMEISQGRRCLQFRSQDEKDLSPTYGKEKLPKSFEEMQRHGVKITSGEERIG